MIFDFDSNLLYMSTPIHIKVYENGKWISKDILPEEFAKIRKDNNWRNRGNLTFQEFRDIGPRGKKAFIEDAKEAVRNGKFGPSFQDFINTLINGNIFLIITARGHEPEIMKNFVKWLICNYMTEEQRYKMLENLRKFRELFNSKDDSIKSYLNTCEFIGIMSKYFKKRFGIEFKGDVESGKEVAINSFLERLENFATKIGAKLKVGFSDDDEMTIKHITDFFKEKDLDVSVDYYIFNTSNKKKKRIKLKN
jgi:hypothetical protein